MRTIIAANWKMNKTRAQAEAVAAEIAAGIAAGKPEGRDVIVFPPATALGCVSRAAAGAFETGIQNLYPAEDGAYTGEIAPCMVHEAGGAWALCGHSERRHIFGESDELIAKKVDFSLDHDLKVMLCVGETLAEREAGALSSVLRRQLSSALSGQAASRLPFIAVAYEPVWAIGTGKTAGPAEILEAHAEIRNALKVMFGPAANEVPILYGGSVKPANTASILALDNVDGVLVGGASLAAKSFLGILNA